MAAEKRVYLGYAWPDRAFAESLRASLANHGIGSVVHDMDLGPGSDWKREMAENLAHAEALVVLLGETTNQSSFVEHEAILARELGKPVLIVKLDPGYVLPSVLYDVAATWTDVSRSTDAVVALLGNVKAP
jgi:hypothetical protein